MFYGVVLGCFRGVLWGVYGVFLGCFVAWFWGVFEVFLGLQPLPSPLPLLSPVPPGGWREEAEICIGHGW